MLVDVALDAGAFDRLLLIATFDVKFTVEQGIVFRTCAVAVRAPPASEGGLVNSPENVSRGWLLASHRVRSSIRHRNDDTILC